MRRRRIGAALAFATAAGLVAALVAGTAVAAGDRAAARSNSRWLASKLAPDGTLENPNGGSLPDYGLMLDVLFALHASGDGALAAPVVDYLDDKGHATDYYTWDALVPDSGFDAIIVGGAAAKVLVAAQIAGRDPHRFDGHDMVAETRDSIRRSGPDKGRISDYSKNPDFADFVTNNANMFGQALGVIGLAAAGENDRLALDTMLTQQCSEGYFRIFFGYIPTTETGDHVTPNGYKVSTCDEGKPFDLSSPDGDTTGLALSAMLAAKRAGAEGLDEPIGRTVSWLTAHQTASGGWGGGVGTEAANTNSTGLIVQALADAGGSDSAVDRGVGYLKSAQATAEADGGTSLAGELGAIAYNPGAYTAARATGISGLDTWLRASAQASLGLSQVGWYALARGEMPEEPSTTGTTTTTTGSSTTTTSAEATTATRTVTVVPAPRTIAGAKAQVVQPTSSTVRPSTTTPGARLGAYLANRVVNGDHVEVTEDGKTYVDYDATADLVLALRALGEQPETVARATDFLLGPDAVQAYAHGAPYEQGSAAYAEPLAKLVVVAQFARADDLAARLRGDLVALRGEDGRFTDRGAFADADDTTARHAWALLATAGDPGVAVDVLLAAQCADGTFPEHLGDGKCASGDLAATAAAVTALNARPHTESTAPVDWSPQRLKGFLSAVTALSTRPASGEFDVPVAAAVAAARQVAGLDASDTARTLGELVLADGGLARGSAAASDGRTDFATSLAAAQGVAGRSWLSAASSPLSPAVRLPLADVKTADPQPVAAAFPTPPWLVWALSGFGAALLAIAFLLVLVLRRVIKTKGVAP
ncbi:hypothetical protein [Umezawaea sp. NPDC059074]|uniref:hypothetical protein n=1 Tax=Umezawaea sp. NPDC059074 TaxID=3346716 RepID=UPI00369B5B87